MTQQQDAFWLLVNRYLVMPQLPPQALAVVARLVISSVGFLVSELLRLRQPHALLGQHWAVPW